MRRAARDRPLLQQRGEPVGLGPLAPGELGGERVEVDLRQVDQRVGFDALGRGPDHVLLGADRAVEQRVDGVGDRVEVGLRWPGDVGDPLGQHPDGGDGALVVGGRRVGQQRLEQLAGVPSGGQELGARLLVDQQRLHRGVAQGDVARNPAASRSSSRSTS